ncbi:hypothetical protein G5B37_09130 [Rasiella rasia]|uniref:Uncharacterized protein n=1 Tax=Rasiella rasia TaxID=2744027 RepID=A0A6G6GHK0_9FLAO|nr:hypothetical protein [Rasiella rasia]QIE58004.1 hypothetical protein G5B37_09130 [Rasiella rasia]
MNLLNVPLVNWGLGTIMIIIFAVVCVVLVAVVYSLSRSTKRIEDEDSNTMGAEDEEHTLNS